jgi:hypothetical protein
MGEMNDRIDAIKATCTRWGIPPLGTNVKVTILIHDPTNTAMSYLQTDETSVDDIMAVLVYLKEHGR